VDEIRGVHSRIFYLAGAIGIFAIALIVGGVVYVYFSQNSNQSRDVKSENAVPSGANFQTAYGVATRMTDSKGNLTQYSKSGDRIFFHDSLNDGEDRVMLGADSNSFVILGNATADSAKDKNHYYYFGWPVQNIDPESVVLLTVPSTDGDSWSHFLKDKNAVYYIDVHDFVTFSNVDPDTFTINNGNQYQDKNHIYVVSGADLDGVDVTREMKIVR
jgi:hypothetical protein